MSRAVFAGVGRVLPQQWEAFRRDVAELTGPADLRRVRGFVFLDPEDGLRPLTLAREALAAAPGAEVVLPLVCRDANRTALLGEARSAELLGARGLVLLSGHLEPSCPARAVYDLDPLQLLGFLREQGIRLELWAAGRCETAAERARLAALAGAGATRCLVPWEPGDSAPEVPSLPAVAWVGEPTWAEGVLPPGQGGVLLETGPGRGPAALAQAARLGGR